MRPILHGLIVTVGSTLRVTARRKIWHVSKKRREAGNTSETLSTSLGLYLRCDKDLSCVAFVFARIYAPWT